MQRRRFVLGGLLVLLTAARKPQRRWLTLAVLASVGLSVVAVSSAPAARHSVHRTLTLKVNSVNGVNEAFTRVAVGKKVYLHAALHPTLTPDEARHELVVIRQRKAGASSSLTVRVCGLRTTVEGYSCSDLPNSSVPVTYFFQAFLIDIANGHRRTLIKSAVVTVTWVGEIPPQNVHLTVNGSDGGGSAASKKQPLQAVVGSTAQLHVTWTGGKLDGTGYSIRIILGDADLNHSTTCTTGTTCSATDTRSQAIIGRIYYAEVLPAGTGASNIVFVDWVT